ncbi:SDR family NAD(P)-dependent oxidoreductase [Roseivivax isoporae]|uniref:Short-chain dehydrogenase n=1 Tax=Roseivivax isoporae LMG 25204 TaxID=1449351 RepID=X7F6T4_9RHOB|nr:SDR family oxidoreductase [Roseivivax isoporae]ETX28607.1 short-chain dehydrogenase [Roseivivax isoporae LMG 25204]
MRIDLSGRVFAVTGAAQGIGAAIVAGLAAAGARVAAIDIDGAGMDRLEAAASRHAADLGRRDAVHATFDEIRATHHRLDGLVTAAGGVRGQAGRPLEEIGEDDWRAILAANVDAAMWCAQAAAPALKAAGAGRIVTISSGAGLRPSLTGIQAYAAAKHALVGLTRQLALELGPHGITVNSVAPGFVLSNPSTERQWHAFGPERQAQVIAGTHMRRLGRPEDIADAVTFLASDRAGWISGQVLSVDGGHA